MPLLDDIAIYLESLGVGTRGVTLFEGTLPQEGPGLGPPDQVIALYEIPGMGAEHIHNVVGPAVEQPSVQVRVRGAPFGYAQARALAQQAFLALDGLTNQTLNGTFYRSIFALQSPFGLGTDAWNRPAILFNIRCAKAP